MHYKEAKEVSYYLNPVSSSGTDFEEISLNRGQSKSKYTENNNSDASSVKSPINEPSEHLKAAASPKNESITVIASHVLMGPCGRKQLPHC